MASVELATGYKLLAHTQTFSGRAFWLASIYGGNNEEKCFRVEDNDNKLYKVRFATATSRRSVASEHEAFRILREHEFDWTPHVYEVQFDEPAYLIISYAEGESLDKSLCWMPHAESLVAGLERLLTDIHSIRGDYFGHLKSTKFSSWQAFIDVRLWRHVLPLARAGLVSEGDLRNIRALYEEASEALRNIRPSLLHGDVKPANIIFNEDSGNAVLVDFELARFGDVDFEWSKLYRLSLRWPEYRTHVALPLLERSSFNRPREQADEAKMLLYALYHACSFLDFELETGLTSPEYRISDLAELLRVVHQRLGNR
jgi:aminoglycoside phosphotransferase (APT) family kinase protein